MPGFRDTPPLWREGRVGLETARLLRDPVLAGEGVPHGDGAPVLLIPGFLAGDGSLVLMTHWLRRLGYRTRRAGIRFNVGCATEGMGPLEARLEAMAAAAGRPVAIVGQSRGGTFARLLAVRRPDLVSGIVTLGSPLLDPLSVHPAVRAQVSLVGLLGTAGVPGLFRLGCMRGDCCAAVREQYLAPIDADIPFVSIYSRSDGIVGWRSCLDPYAEHVEIRSSHLGMAAHPGAYRAIAQALAASTTTAEPLPAAA